MGFLSRKNKSKPVAVEEPHPIVEELQRMEEVVPEREERWDDEVTNDEQRWDDEDSERPPAGPVAEDDPSSSQAAGDVPSSTPPADERIDVDPEARVSSEVGPTAPVAEASAGPSAAATVAEVAEPASEGPERFMPRDLLAPSRHEVVVERVEEETPVKHADVIAFANQKGGVAKTTTTLNLAVAFAESGYKVLCIDLDPQGNLTMSQGIDPDKVEKSLYDVLVNDMPISEIIVEREIDIAVASIDLAGAEIAMSTKIGRERSLEKALKEVSGYYDFVCIDTPPSLGLLTINALTAANKVIVPVQCEYLSMRGLVQLQNTLKMIQENLNPDVKIEGILPTMLDARTVHAKEAVEILEENFGDLVFKSRIRKAIKFAEAPVKGASVLKYDSGSSAANYYRELAKEVLANNESAQ
ncbi:MAG TPA: AAA family ATPase [Solirubrobacterales bacterium]|nr:AAA family ATPase [Solirubrobacterales bacterium]